MKNKLFLFLLFLTFLGNQIVAKNTNDNLIGGYSKIIFHESCSYADSIKSNKITKITRRVKASLLPPSVIAGSSCGDGISFVQVNVYANGSSVDEQIEWYGSQNAISPLYTGFVYSPSIKSTKTFYVQSKSKSTNEVSIRVPVVASVYLSPNPVSISVFPSNSSSDLLCPNTAITFTANGGGDLFEFSVEGVVVKEMSESRSYSSSSLLNGQSVSVRSRFTKVLDGSITEPAWGTGAVEDNVLASSLSVNGSTAYITSLKISPEENNFIIGISGKIDKNSSVLLFLDSKTGGFNISNYGDVLGSSGVKGFNYFNNNPSTFDSYFQADYCLVISTDATELNYFADIIELKSGGSIKTSLGSASPGSPSSLFGVNNNNTGTSNYTLGFEIGILKSLIGYTTGDVKFFGFTMKDTDEASYSVTNSFLSPEITSILDYGNSSVDYNLKDPNPIVFSASGLVPCYSNDNFVINLFELPVTSSIVQPSCIDPFGEITIVNQNGAEYSIDGITYQTSNIFSRLDANSYTLYIRKSSDGTCVSSSLSPIIINEVPATPLPPSVASIAQPTCETPSGTLVIGSQSGVEYSLDGITYQESNTFSGLTPDSYTLYVRNIGDSTCMAISTSATIVNAVPMPPSVPTAANVVQPTCAITSGTIEVTAQSGVEYSLDGTNYQLSNSFSGLAPNDYELYVRNSVDATCITTSAAVTSINAVPLPPPDPIAADVTQPTCAIPTGTILIDAQAGIEYSLDGLTYGTSNLFSGLAPNNYTLFIRNSGETSCISTSASVITINVVPVPPLVPTVLSVVQPTCETPSGSLVIELQIGAEYSLDGITYQEANTFSGLAPDSYTLYVRNIGDRTCMTNSTTTTIVNVIPRPPVIPTVASVVQPTCATISGTIEIAVQSGVEYSLDGTNYQASNIFSALTPKDYILYVRNLFDFSCVTSSLAVVTINPIKVITIPITSNSIQPTCAIPSGTIVVETQAGAEYSLDGLNYQTSNTFSGLVPNDYTLYIRSISDSSCANVSSSPLKINAVPTAPIEPVEAGIVQPTCEIPSGSIAIVIQTGVEYSLGGVEYQVSNLFAGLVPNNYALFVRNIGDSTCSVQSIGQVTIDPLPPLPLVPTVDRIIQPTCLQATGTIVISAQNDVQYSIGTGYQDSPEFENLLPGTYNISVRFTSSTACISNGALQTIKPVPPQIQFEIMGVCESKDFVLKAIPLVNSYNSSEVSYQWKDNTGGTVGTDSSIFNVSNLIASSSVIENFPLNYTLTIISTPNGCETTNSVAIEGIYCDIQKGISPDGNGSNDYFDLKLLKVKKLQVFDRYGIKVYSQANYTDQWKGQSDSGNELPSATYYYVIEFNNSELKTGWIYLIREKL
jgi:gliding motility-associated-like protein